MDFFNIKFIWNIAQIRSDSNNACDLQIDYDLAWSKLVKDKIRLRMKVDLPLQVDEITIHVSDCDSLQLCALFSKGYP